MNKIYCFALLTLLATACKISSELLPVEPGGTRHNAVVFPEVSITENIVYGMNTAQGGQLQELFMDVYQPAADTVSQRPLVVLAHGGGFVGGDKDDMLELAMFLAQSGYVAVSIRYRLVNAEQTPRNELAAAVALCIVQAGHDMKAAIRYFVHDAATSNQYRINPHQVFIGGYSAGAFTALQAAYVNDDSEAAAFNIINPLATAYI